MWHSPQHSPQPLDGAALSTRQSLAVIVTVGRLWCSHCPCCGVLQHCHCHWTLVQLVSRLVTEDCWRAGESITDNKHKRHCHRRCCSSSSSLLSRQSLAVTATVGRLCCSHCRRRWQTSVSLLADSAAATVGVGGRRRIDTNRDSRRHTTQNTIHSCRRRSTLH